MPSHTVIFIVHVCGNALHIGTQCLNCKYRDCVVGSVCVSKPCMVHVCTYHPPIHVIALTAIPVLSPVLFMPSLYILQFEFEEFLVSFLFLWQYVPPMQSGQANEKSSRFQKGAYRDGVKREETPSSHR